MRHERLWPAMAVVLIAIIAVWTGMGLAGDQTSDDAEKGWHSLFNGKDLTGWEMIRPGSWVVEEGAIARKGGADLWTVEQFGNFILDLEFKVAPGTNSGVCLRVPRNPEVQPWWRDGALEVQILDSSLATPSSLHQCGALCDLVGPSKNVARKPGEWNHLTITAIDSRISVVMNGEKIVDADLDKWIEPGKNPDGTPNKYAKAMKDAPRRGHIFLQEHGSPVWFRKISIKPLD